MSDDELAERIYRGIRTKMMPYRIWPDPKPDVIKVIMRALKKRKERKCK